MVFSTDFGVTTHATFRPQLPAGASDASVGQRLWDHLVDSRTVEATVAISISLATRMNSWSYSAPSWICWASLDKEVDGLLLSEEWKDRLRQPSSLTIGVCDEVMCTVSAARVARSRDIVLQSLSKDSFELACINHSTIESSLCLGRKILRRGSCYSSNGGLVCDSSGPHRHGYKIISMDPHMQGYAEKGYTRFTLLRWTPNMERINAAPFDSVTEDLEIGEQFFASSLAPQFTPRIPMRGPIISPFSVALPFLAVPLRCQDYQDLSECTVYIATSDLTKLRTLNSDWAVIRPTCTGSPRLVRLQADDEIVQVPGTVAASALLLRNISADSEHTCQILLQAAPSDIRGFSLPIAKSITVARIASKVSTTRLYQSLVLQSLKAFFYGHRRLIKQNDLIEVQMNTESMKQTWTGTPSSMNTGLEVRDEVTDTLTYPSYACKRVYFSVTNIEMVSGAASDAGTTEVSLGELGCWVDPAVTRILQAGVANSRLPQLDVSDLCKERIHHSTFPRAAENKRAGRMLSRLVLAALTRDAVTYDIPVSILVKGARGIGKFTNVALTAQQLGCHILEVDCFDIVVEDITKAEAILRARFDQATLCAPCVLVLRHLEALSLSTNTAGREPVLVNVLSELVNGLQGPWRLSGYPTLAVGTTSDLPRVSATLLSCFKHEISIEAPAEEERANILGAFLMHNNLSADLSLQRLSKQAAAFNAVDLEDLAVRGKTVGMLRVMRLDPGLRQQDILQAGISLGASDFLEASQHSRSSYAQNIGAPTIPSVSWDDVGGLNHVKKDILDTVQLPLEHPELFARDLKKRSGILLYGPPGTGKTLLAKAVATSCSLNFFSVKGPELLNMYIGESEANVRRVFQRARDARPCVIFFDELDSVAPKRGNLGDSGGVMDRIVSQLLAELDGISSGEGGDVFVIGATNRPDLLDPALLRPGRFDRMLYLGISDTDAAQLNVLQALTRKFRLDAELDLRNIVEQCPFTFTGADFYALCSDALLKAMSRKAEEIDTMIVQCNNLQSIHNPQPMTSQYYLTEVATPRDILVTVSKGDFEASLHELVPSVSQSELEHYARIRQQFS
ncbi:AAA-domain-containing protein [Dentipellis sp. KUC8613]|nr:AAA-domain-containing protein [Dentipellis sp. KUC8613]